MTPTLRGRWQTRWLMSLTVGVMLTALVGGLVQDFKSAFAGLGYMTAFGFVWDVMYMRLQSWRWDHDWPPVLYLAGAVWELVVLVGVVQGVELPGIAPDYGLLPLILQYGTIGLLSFFLVFGPMRVLFPRGRFRGGQWL